MGQVEANQASRVALQAISPARATAEAPAPQPGAPVDRLQLGRRVVQAQPFSWGKAAHHFGQGFRAQGAEMVKAIVQQPLAALGAMAVGGLLLAAAPLVGLSAATLGTALAVGFGAWGAFRMARGCAQAWQRRHDPRAAEAAFQEVGRGGFDLSLALLPALLGRLGRHLSWRAPAESPQAVAELEASLAKMGHQGRFDFLNPTFSRMRPGLLRGGAPTSVADFELLSRRHGVKTIVNFLVPGNPKELGLIRYGEDMALKLGMKYHTIPLDWGKAPDPATLERFLTILRDPASGPIYLHCRLGRDRTGAMAAATRILQEGWSPARAFEEMKRFGFQAEGGFEYLRDFVLGLKP